MLFIPKAGESCWVLGKGRNISRRCWKGEGTGSGRGVTSALRHVEELRNRGTSKGCEDLLKVRALWRMWELGAAFQRLLGTHRILSGTAHRSG